MKISSLFFGSKEIARDYINPKSANSVTTSGVWKTTWLNALETFHAFEQFSPPQMKPGSAHRGLTQTKQLDFGCCFFEEILEIDFSEKKKKTSTVYLKKILSHQSSWKLPLFPINNIYISQRLHPPSFRLPSNNATQLAFGFGPRERCRLIPKESWLFATPIWAMRQRAPG